MDNEFYFQRFNRFLPAIFEISKVKFLTTFDSMRRPAKPDVPEAEDREATQRIVFVVRCKPYNLIRCSLFLNEPLSTFQVYQE